MTSLETSKSAISALDTFSNSVKTNGLLILATNIVGFDSKIGNKLSNSFSESLIVLH